MRATCAVSCRRGWQHENIMRSRSSLMACGSKSSSSAGARVHSLCKASPSAAKLRAVRSRRSTSSAQFLAVAISQAEGLRGTPRKDHTSSARQNASCTTSSANARLRTPKMRATVAAIRPDSRLNR